MTGRAMGSGGWAWWPTVLGLWAALALLAGLNWVERSRPVVEPMQPIEWCRDEEGVQALMYGTKRQAWWPVEGSQAGYADGREVGFAFLDDPAPGSAKPLGWQSFGWWRWTAPLAAEVTATLIHTDGSREKLSSYGPYRVPGPMRWCTKYDR